MTYTVICNNNISIMDEDKLYSLLTKNGITETSGGSEAMSVPGWTKYEGDRGFTCLVYDGNDEHKQYKVVHKYDVDGGFGDAVYEEDVLTKCPTKKDAEMIVEAYGNPHVYDTPYDDLHCGDLEVREDDKTQTFAEFVINHPKNSCWWLH